MKSFKFKDVGRFYLEREGDSSGDSGGMFYSIDPETKEAFDAEVRVGCMVKCGSAYARTMQWQDWWRTSVVTEILEVKENRVKFKTRNSIYNAWGE